MSLQTDRALVKKDRLWVVAGNDRYRVNNKYDRTYSPQPVTKIVLEAESLVGQMMPYNVASKNCEHFVTRLRYGMAKSDQVCSCLACSLFRDGVYMRIQCVLLASCRSQTGLACSGLT